MRSWSGSSGVEVRKGGFREGGQWRRGGLGVLGGIGRIRGGSGRQAAGSFVLGGNSLRLLGLVSSTAAHMGGSARQLLGLVDSTAAAHLLGGGAAALLLLATPPTLILFPLALLMPLPQHPLTNLILGAPSLQRLPELCGPLPDKHPAVITPPFLEQLVLVEVQVLLEDGGEAFDVALEIVRQDVSSDERAHQGISCHKWLVWVLRQAVRCEEMERAGA